MQEQQGIDPSQAAWVFFGLVVMAAVVPWLILSLANRGYGMRIVFIRSEPFHLGKCGERLVTFKKRWLWVSRRAQAVGYLGTWRYFTSGERCSYFIEDRLNALEARRKWIDTRIQQVDDGG